MHDIDQALVIRIALFVAREITEIRTGGEKCVHTLNGRDLARLLRAADSLNHLDQHHVVVNRIAVTAWNRAPEIRRIGLSLSLAALAERRKVGPVASCLAFL